MKFVKEILARVFALWTIIWFIVTMIIVSIPVWIIGLWSEPKRTVFLCNIFRVWMRFFFFIIGLRLKVKGKENFRKGETYIIVCNHNTLIDIPVSTPQIPGANKTIAKIEMSRIPIFGMLYKRGSVLVDRKNEESRKASYIKMKKVLELGMHMCIYPEGTRNRTSEPLQRFHDGAFKLSVETGCSILPAVISNTTNVIPNNKTFYFWPGKIEMHFLEPVSPSSQTTEQLKEKIFNLIMDHFCSIQKKLVVEEPCPVNPQIL